MRSFCFRSRRPFSQQGNTPTRAIAQRQSHIATMIGTGTTVGTTSVIGTITDIVGIATITIDTIDKRALALKQRRVCNALTQARNGYSVGSLPSKDHPAGASLKPRGGADRSDATKSESPCALSQNSLRCFERAGDRVLFCSWLVVRWRRGFLRRCRKLR